MYRVFIAICYKVNAFLEQKKIFLRLKFFFLKKFKWDNYEYLKTFFQRQNFMSEKARTLRT